VSGQIKNKHGDIHNVYNLLWHKSIYDGYRRNQTPQRNFMVSRSGAIGLQRFGGSMWSADISSNYKSLTAHMNAQMHLSFSGIDYYSSDIGGFHRKNLDGDLNVLYTRWLANSMWLDFPARAHVENLCNCKQVTPDKIGIVESNLANIRQRYEMVPYFYNLAYRAFLFGEPVIPPLVYYYQNDVNVRSMGNEKMIGKDLLFALVASNDEVARNVYLPQGEWYNFHTNEYVTAVSSAGYIVNGVPTYLDNIFRVPIFARGGAIIPRATVDEQTMNVFGKRKDGTYNHDFVVRVYQQQNADLSETTIYEDDGTSRDYETKSTAGFAQTPIAAFSRNTTVYIGATIGDYKFKPVKRNYIVEYVVKNLAARGVTINGRTIAPVTKSQFSQVQEGYYNETNLIRIKSQQMSAADLKVFAISTYAVRPQSSANFVCKATTELGENMYIIGSSPTLGNWQTNNAVKLEPNLYPVWSKWVQGFSETSGEIQWKCAKRKADGTFVISQAGASSIVFYKNDGGFQGTSTATFQ